MATAVPQAWVEELRVQVGEKLQDFASGLRSVPMVVELESRLRVLERRFAALLLEAVATALVDLDEALARSTCPVCGCRLHVNRKETLTLQLLEGEVEIRRNYCECREHKFYCYPLDAALGLVSSGECTPQFAHDLCLLSAELPTSAGTRVLQTLTGRTLSDGTVKAEVERAGDALVELERREAEALWPYDDEGQPRDVSGADLPRLHAPPVPCGTLIVSMDGVMANLGGEQDIRAEVRRYEEAVKELKVRGQEPKGTPTTSWREVRVLRLFRLADVVEKTTKSGKKRRQISKSETIAVANAPLLFEKRTNAVLHVWEAQKYSQRVLIMDGSSVLWDLGKTLVDPTVEILDVRHAQSHVYECGKALYGVDTDKARQWGRAWAKSLKRKGPKQLRAELQNLATQQWPEDAARTLANLIDYVTEHYHRMDYPKFVKMGLPIGSGAIESANRQVVVDRCKRSGMRWCRRGLQHILSLRCALLSGNWERIGEAIRAHRSYQLRLEEQRRLRALEAQPAPVPAVQPTKRAKPVRRPPTVARVHASNTDSRVFDLIPQRKVERLLRAGVITQAVPTAHRRMALGG
jgi:hypothetical protein